MTGAPAVTPPRRRRKEDELIDTAERMLADHGIEVMSLRKIGAAAGHRNPAVVQYYFGTKDGLLRAIIDARLPQLNARRAELLEAIRADEKEHDVRSIIDALVRPMVELGPTSYFVRFLAQLSSGPKPFDEYSLTSKHAENTRVARRWLEEALGDLPADIRRHRINLARDFMLRAIAARHTELATGMPAAIKGDDRFVHDLYDCLEGLLLAPHTTAEPANRRRRQRPPRAFTSGS